MKVKRGIEKRLKRHLLREQHRFLAVCAKGLEQVLEAEVRRLPEGTEVCRISGGVEFSGPLGLIYYANLYLGSAHRVLIRIASFRATNFPMLFDQVRRIRWEYWIQNSGTYSLRVSSKGSKLNMKERIASTLRGGIEQRLAGQGVEAHYAPQSKYEFFVRLSNNYVTLSFNSSGEHLHFRGYKRATVAAPIRETLAVAALELLDFESYSLLVDPFCGSGTFLLEAARLHAGITPAQFRSFAFEQAPFFREPQFGHAKASSRGSTEKLRFLGFDSSRPAVQASIHNAVSGGLNTYVQFEHNSFESLDFKALGTDSKRRLLITNPPYDRRVQKHGKSLRGALHDKLPELSGWTLAVVSQPSFFRQLVHESKTDNLWIESVIDFENGGLPVQLAKLRVR